MDYGALLGGIGIFLFGMMLFEETIRSFGIHSLRKILKKYTNNRFKSMLVGIIQTVVVQSSTIVTMMTLGFVGAGALGVVNALGVVIGANIGTTVTPWLIALLGFNVQIDIFALPMIGIGVLLKMLGPSRLHSFSKIIIGFGLIFLGLDFMKDSVDALSSSISLEQFAHFSFLGFVCIGIIVTVMIQTSTGATVIFLTALNSGLITLDISLALVIGANIGSSVTTTIMGMLSSKKEQYEKRQVALSHLLFNVMTFAIVWLLYPMLYKSLFVILGSEAPPVLLLALFHTLYNVILALVCLPLLKPLVHLLNKIFPTPKQSLGFLIENIDTKNTEELLEVLIVNTGILLEKTRTYSRSIWHLEGMQAYKKSSDYYVDIKKLERLLLNTMTHASMSRTPQEQETFYDMQKLIMEVITSSKYLKDISHHIDNLYEQNDNSTIQKNFIFLQESVNFHTQYSDDKQKIFSETGYGLDILSRLEIEYDPAINTSEILKVTYYVQLSLQAMIRAQKVWFIISRDHHRSIV